MKSRALIPWVVAGGIITVARRRSETVESRYSELANRLDAVLASTDQGLYGLDCAGDITFVNRSTLEQTGYTPESVLGHNAHALWHHTRADGSLYPGSECPVDRAVRSGKSEQILEDVLWRSDGTSFPVESSTYPLLENGRATGAVVTFIDVTARKLAERQSETQDAVTRVLGDSSSVGEALSPLLAAICRGLGFEIGLAWVPNADLSEIGCWASYVARGAKGAGAWLSHGVLAAGEGPAGSSLASGEAVVWRDLERQPPRRSVAPSGVPKSAVAIPVFGIASELVAVAEFFGDEVAVEEDVVDTLTTIVVQVVQHLARRSADEEIYRLREQFVANVSHELRTPLTAIDGWLQIVLGGEAGPLTDEQGKFLGIVKRNSERLTRLVGDLLLAGQIESGTFDLDLVEVDVAVLVREATELVAAAATGKQLRVSVEAPGAIIVRGDRARLMQLLNNLLANAVKFTPEGGWISVGVAVSEGTCRITVADSGIGIPTAERVHIFERFYRASSATSRGITGTGLGLAISKAITEGHGGSIWLEEEERPGTVFVVELPRVVREEAQL
jgi:PAS domain S-box-containing protein